MLPCKILYESYWKIQKKDRSMCYIHRVNHFKKNGRLPKAGNSSHSILPYFIYCCFALRREKRNSKKQKKVCKNINDLWEGNVVFPLSFKENMFNIKMIWKEIFKKAERKWNKKKKKNGNRKIQRDEWKTFKKIYRINWNKNKIVESKKR